MKSNANHIILFTQYVVDRFVDDQFGKNKELFDLQASDWEDKFAWIDVLVIQTKVQYHNELFNVWDKLLIFTSK